MGLKLRLYEAGVVSVLVYGCECWDLTVKAATSLRSWNARRMSMITGKEIREEYKHPSFDLLGCARARRLKWAKQLLRAPEDFIPRRTAMAELERYGGGGQPGGIFQDAPKGVTVEELVELANRQVFWSKEVRKLLPESEQCRQNKAVIEQLQRELEETTLTGFRDGANTA